MIISQYQQILDWENLQVFEKYMPFDRRNPMRGTHHYLVKGKEDAIRGWIDGFIREYPPSGYGTSFQLTDVAGDKYTYVGTRVSSCD